MNMDSAFQTVVLFSVTSLGIMGLVWLQLWQTSKWEQVRVQELIGEDEISERLVVAASEPGQGGRGSRRLLVALILVVGVNGCTWWMGLPIDILVVLNLIVLVVLGIAFKSRTSQPQKIWRRQIDYHLPLVIEQIVMAVTAGHDVYSALKIVLVGEDISQRDPVTQLLAQVIELNDAGLSLENAFSQVVKEVDSVGLRHAFLHLAVAHREGGSLIEPLRELSDAVALFYQEKVEEEIAILPIKGTVPLVIAFAGLMICILTIPVMQVLETTRGGKFESSRSIEGGLSRTRFENGS